MSQGRDADGVLVEWGTRLFYPRPKARGGEDGALTAKGYLLGRISQPTPATIRHHIRAAVSAGGKQVMVKITGGGRGLAAPRSRAPALMEPAAMMVATAATAPAIRRYITKILPAVHGSGCSQLFLGERSLRGG